MSDTSSDTISEVSDAAPNPPIYPRPHGQSYATRSSVNSWLETAEDWKDDPMEVDPDSLVCSNSSPAAPIERSTLRMLPTKRPLRPPPKRPSLVARRLSNRTLIDNDFAVTVPGEEVRPLLKDKWQLQPRFSPNAAEGILLLKEDSKLSLSDWLDIDKLRKDGHMADFIAEVFEILPDVSQQLEEQAEEQDGHQGDELMPSIEVDVDNDDKHSIPGSFYYWEYQAAREGSQTIENEVKVSSRQPASLYGPDQLMLSIETDDYDEDDIQSAFDRDATEDAMQVEADNNRDGVQLPPDHPHNPASDLDLSEPAGVFSNNPTAQMEAGSDPEVLPTLYSALDELHQRLSNPAEVTTHNQTVRLRLEGDADKTHLKDFSEILMWSAQVDPSYSKSKEVENTLNNIVARMQPENDPVNVHRAVQDFNKLINWRNQNAAPTALHGQTDEVDHALEVREQFKEVRRHTPENEANHPDFAHAVQQHALQLDPNKYHIPSEIEFESEHRRPQLLPAIWQKEVTPDGQTDGNVLVDDDDDDEQAGMPLQDLHMAIMRGDFDLILNQNWGDELNDFNEAISSEHVHGLDPNAQNGVISLVEKDPLVDPAPLVTPVIPDPGRIDSAGDNNQDIGSSTPISSHRSPSLNGAGEESNNYMLNITNGLDTIDSPPVRFLHSLVADGFQEDIDEVNGNYAGFRPRPLLNETAEHPKKRSENASRNKEIGNSRPPLDRSLQFADRLINATLISDGQEFLRRRADIISRALSPDGEVDSMFDGLVLSKEIKRWLVDSREDCSQLSLNPASPSSTSQHPFSLQGEPDYYQFGYYLTPEQEDFQSLSRSVSPLEDCPAKYLLSDDEFEGMVEDFYFHPMPITLRDDIHYANRLKRSCVRAEAATSPAIDMDMNISDSSPLAELLSPSQYTTAPEPEIQVVTSSVIDISMDAHPSSTPGDEDTLLALEGSSATDQEPLLSAEQTADSEFERQVISTPDRIYPLPIVRLDSFKLGAEADMGADLNRSLQKDVERSVQDPLMSEPELPAESVAATTPGISSPAVGLLGVRKYDIKFSFRKATETSSSEAEMDLVDSEDEIDMIKTSPIHSAPIHDPGLSSNLALTKPDNWGKALMSTYEKGTYVDKANDSLPHRVYQRNLVSQQNTSSLRGPVQGSHYRAGAASLDNRSNRRQQLLTMVGPQNPCPSRRAQVPGGQGEGNYSEVQIQQTPQRSRGVPAKFDVNNDFAPQLHNPIPQLLTPSLGTSMGQSPQKFTFMDPVNPQSYLQTRTGGYLGGKSKRGGGDSHRGRGYGRERSMISSNPYKPRDSSLHEQANSDTMFFSSPPKNLSQGSNTTMSSPEFWHTHGIGQDNSPTPKPHSKLETTRHHGGPGNDRCPKGTQKEQRHQSPAQVPPPHSQQIRPFPGLYTNASAQLPPKPPSTQRVSPQNPISPRKPGGELYMTSFRNPENYRTALATLIGAKEKDGKNVEISEEFDRQNGQTIKITGPKLSMVRKWVRDLVPYGREVEHRFYE